MNGKMTLRSSGGYRYNERERDRQAAPLPFASPGRPPEFWKGVLSL